MYTNECYRSACTPEGKGSELDGDNLEIPECFCRRGIDEGKAFPITNTKAATPGNYSTVTAACSSSRSAPAASAKSAWQLSAAGGAA
mmetsp:Transcript_71657/g.140632  ORF Transcript_71657/g.140632 Transcript_71657/m.140632 type:complete len:87 (+) Transcript_71657:566-826(+)